MMPKSSVEVIVQKEGNLGSPKGLQERKIETRKVTSVVPATGPPMIKSDNWKKKGQRLCLDYNYESSDEKGEKVSPLGFSITYIYI